ncbi:C40 family peptidase [Arthrobacter sp. zg-Y916]|uniref:NlpC/P60 family protein n=1 Tax=Arthrobacter sp. zg-Y916 TaxID=2894190 RepID=UPI001E40B8BB|nr:NlpC/P60 family protein [Arthrobacter sp. zg-Y916]MCC9194556.1 C40 family peptidase [Arthrobacter sp. zg-Y916]
MTSTTERARHRAPVQRTSTLTALAGAVSTNAGTMGRQAAVIAAASGLVLTTGVAANAAGAETSRDVQTSKLDLSSIPLQVPADAAGLELKLAQVPGVIAAEQSVVEAEIAETAETADISVQSQEVIAPSAQAQGTGTAAAAPAQAAPAVASGVGATIAAAAYAQLGVMQDCTMLATNALAAAGINYHGWPAGYLSLGRTVGAAEALPGDLIYYADGGMGLAHIAVYVGNGQAIHGGFFGNQTVVAPAELGSGGVYIRVGG